jgi:FixJ family two-component response regulator
MPVMGGLELVEKLRRMRPGLPVVLMSGYSDRRVERSLLMEFIEKPFHPPALLDLLRNVLDSSVEYDNGLRAAS